MFLRLSAQYKDLVKDLVLSLQALAESLHKEGVHASCYSCGDGSQGASFVADLLDGHAVRFLVSDYTKSFEESTKIFFGSDVKLENYPLWD